MTDIEIAQKTKLSHIKYIAKKLNLLEPEIEYYGKLKEEPNSFVKINEDDCI